MPHSRSSLAVLMMAAVYLLPRIAFAEQIKVFGVQLPPQDGGGFKPAGTDLVCGVVSKNGLCFDGKKWHRLFPAGPRRYSPVTGPVTCNVIVDADCWDGEHWFRLAPNPN